MKPILIEIPTQIETKRLIIRPPMPGDGPELNAAILDSFDLLCKWMPWAKNRPTVEESEESCRRAYAKWILREDLRVSLFEKKSGKMVGSSGLHRINWEVPRFEIGYWARKQFEGQGYISEAVTAITQFGFRAINAKRIEIRCDANNLKSIKIPERLGFNLESKMKNEDIAYETGDLRDTLVYVRFNDGDLPDVQANWPVPR